MQKLPEKPDDSKILHEWDESLNSQLGYPIEPVDDPRIRILMDYGGLKIVAVEGKDVREGYEMDFTEGGNHGKYEFVPPDEIWLDDWLLDPEQANELWPTLLHELIEYKLMGSDGLAYDDAHKEATIQEMEARKNPKDIKKLVDRAAHEAMDSLGLFHDVGGVIGKAALPGKSTKGSVPSHV